MKSRFLTIRPIFAGFFVKCAKADMEVEPAVNERTDNPTNLDELVGQMAGAPAVLSGQITMRLSAPRLWNHGTRCELGPGCGRQW